MTIEADLRTHLVNDSDVSAIVGSRVYPMRLPQGFDLPAISYQRVSGDRSKDLQGSTGHTEPRIQIDCWAKSYGEIKNLAEKLRLSLDRFTGDLGGGQYVHHVSLEGERDMFEEETEILHVSQDYMISYNEQTS
jgi:hypothetical protein